jgi:hypothetical protein
MGRLNRDARGAAHMQVLRNRGTAHLNAFSFFAPLSTSAMFIFMFCATPAGSRLRTNPIGRGCAL